MNGNPIKEFDDEKSVKTLMLTSLDKEVSLHFKDNYPFEVMHDLNLRFQNKI
jgi:hypothetical protein